MCRMIAFSSGEDVPIEPFLSHLVWMGSEGKRAPHPHGWGYFVLDSSGFVSIVRSGRPINEEKPRSDMKGIVGILHARKASKGTVIDADRAHPYVMIESGGIHVFAHNGGIEDLRDEEIEGLSTGVDTELMMRTIVSEGIEEGYRSLCRRKASSLTMFLYTDGRLHALRHCTKLCEDYYKLYYKIDDGLVVVASEPMEDGWEELENGELMVIDGGEIVEKRVIDCT